MPLTTPAEYKVHNPRAASIADATVAIYIDAVTKALEDEAGRWFAEDTYVETLNGQGLPYILLRAWPVASITSIEILRGDTASVVYPSAYRIDTEAGIVWRTGWNPTVHSILPSRLNGSGDWWRGDAEDLWPEGNQNIRVTYTGGSDPVPADVQLAVWTVVDSMLATRGKDQTLQSENLGSYSYTRGGMGGAAWLATARDVASRLRRGVE